MYNDWDPTDGKNVGIWMIVCPPVNDTITCALVEALSPRMDVGMAAFPSPLPELAMDEIHLNGEGAMVSLERSSYSKLTQDKLLVFDARYVGDWMADNWPHFATLFLHQTQYVVPQRSIIAAADVYFICQSCDKRMRKRVYHRVLDRHHVSYYMFESLFDKVTIGKCLVIDRRLRDRPPRLAWFNYDDDCSRETLLKRHAERQETMRLKLLSTGHFPDVLCRVIAHLVCGSRTLPALHEVN